MKAKTMSGSAPACTFLCAVASNSFQSTLQAPAAIHNTAPTMKSAELNIELMKNTLPQKNSTGTASISAMPIDADSRYLFCFIKFISYFVVAIFLA